jgi:hypothetical protein
MFGRYEQHDTRGKNMAKKTTSAKRCIYCNKKLGRAKSKSPAYHLQYCEEHWAVAVRLKNMRQPCRIVKCKNPGLEDGYCDTHRPFDANSSPLRLDWLEDKGLIKANNPKCPYSGKRNATKAYRGRDATKGIEEIREFLNG